GSASSGSPDRPPTPRTDGHFGHPSRGVSVPSGFPPRLGPDIRTFVRFVRFVRKSNTAKELEISAAKGPGKDARTASTNFGPSTNQRRRSWTFLGVGFGTDSPTPL